VSVPDAASLDRKTTDGVALLPNATVRPARDLNPVAIPAPEPAEPMTGSAAPDADAPLPVENQTLRGNAGPQTGAPRTAVHPDAAHGARRIAAVPAPHPVTVKVRAAVPHRAGADTPTT
jgi:hypothetical protein